MTFKTILTQNGRTDAFHKLCKMPNVTEKIAEKMLEHYQWREIAELNELIRSVK